MATVIVVPSKKVLFILCLLAALALINVWYIYPVRNHSVLAEITLIINESRYLGQPKAANSDELAVDTERCRIPLKDTLPESDKEYFTDREGRSAAVCEAPFDKKPLFRTQSTSTRTCPLLDEDVLLDEYSAMPSNLSCVYQPVMRDEESPTPDRSYKLGESVPFNWSHCPDELELLITCDIVNDTSVKPTKCEQFLLMTSIVDPERLNRPRKSPYFNVLVLGIDSMSRLSFHRTMPKTLQQLKRIYGSRLVELFGFNKVGENSAPNQIPFLTGRRFLHSEDMLDHRYFDDWADYIWREYQHKGYRTLFLEELAKWGLFTYPAREGFRHVQTDYWPRSLMLAMEKLYPFNCYHNETQSSVYLRYLRDTMLLLTRNRPLFAYAWFSLETHGNLAGGWGNDNDFARHFDSLHRSGLLNHTIVLFLADHGFRMGWFRKTVQGTLEDMLPFGFVLLPDEFVQLRPDAFRLLRINSRRLVTPYDIHATLQDLVDPLEPKIRAENYSKRRNVPTTKHGISILSEVIPTTRTCFLAGIPDQFCSCYRQMNETDAKLRLALSEYVVVAVNKILDRVDTRTINGTCQRFSLKTSLQVERIFEGKVFLNRFKVRISTNPGAIFEAVVGPENGGSKTQPSVKLVVLAGGIVRIDKYDEHSNCVKGQSFERFCYCNSAHRPTASILVNVTEGRI